MHWNWQQKDWPDFTYDASALVASEAAFLMASGIIIGTFRHLHEDDKDQMRVDVMSSEAFKTSEIEGDILNRDSLHISIRRHFGLETDQRSP